MECDPQRSFTEEVKWKDFFRISYNAPVSVESGCTEYNFLFYAFLFFNWDKKTNHTHNVSSSMAETTTDGSNAVLHFALNIYKPMWTWTNSEEQYNNITFHINCGLLEACRVVSPKFFHKPEDISVNETFCYCFCSSSTSIYKRTYLTFLVCFLCPPLPNNICKKKKNNNPQYNHLNLQLSLIKRNTFLSVF